MQDDGDSHYPYASNTALFVLLAHCFPPVGGNYFTNLQAREE